jgi:hypothetical protein
MATKEQVKEYLDEQWEKGTADANLTYWEDPVSSEWTATRLGLMQNWMSPEIAVILQKLVGDAIMIERIAKNGSND